MGYISRAKKSYRYFQLQSQKSGIAKRIKKYKNKMKPLTSGVKREQAKLIKVNKELKSL